ncbi:hypothetical protein MTP99_007577 [Tenebrio molitor]|nr:hypothetical protein MTP99_007577 [Tenebrio molitor]
MSQFRSPNKLPNFSQAEKKMIVKVFRGISKDFAELTKTAQMEKTADYTGCGFRNIQRYLAEEKKCGQLQAPKKPDRKCMIQLDEHQKYLI